MIDSTTRLYGLLGNPVSGSKSPWLHNHIFEACGIPGIYLAFPLEPEELGPAVAGLKALKVRGLSITIPYKSDIIPFLDSIDPMAEALGAVNTIVCEGNRWRGYNTDGSGLMAVLKRHVPRLESQKILILGAGGAARGICGALILGGVTTLGIWNRSPERAQQLAAELGSLTQDGQTLTLVTSDVQFSTYDLVINTTSVGMIPAVDATPVAISALKSGAAVCDIVYKPHETLLLKEAKAAGHPVIHGIEMLIEQGLLAQQLWNQLGEVDMANNRNQLMEEFEALYK